MTIYAEKATGEDETRIVSRFDVRYTYQDRSSDNEHRITLRLDESFQWDDDWALVTRVDLPLRYSDRFNAVDNPNGDWKAGIGDVLLQALVTRQSLEYFPWGSKVRPFSWMERETILPTFRWLELRPALPRFRWSTGMRTVLPTATGDQFGTGKLQFGMLVALAYDMPEILNGGYVGLTVRDQFDVAGDSDRNDIHELVIEPKMSFNLNSRWALITAPDIKIDLENDNGLFVPLSLQLSYRDNTTVYSLEVEQSIIDDFSQFDTRIEFRAGFFY